MTDEWLAAYNASIDWDTPTTSSLDADASNNLKSDWEDQIEYWDSVI